MTRWTTLVGGPNDGQRVEDDGRLTYLVPIYEEPSLLATTTDHAQPSYRIGTYERAIRNSDHRAVYVWEGVNRTPRPR